VDDVAGITDPTGRILGLMPHPERHQFAWQSPRFHRGEAPAKPDGLAIFENAVEHLRSVV
jgi:phosphoribosylformylglycinamidine synthase